MKTAIISDIHDNLANLQTCLEICRKENIEAVICCGDVTNDETLGYLSRNFTGPIHLVRGNMDIFEKDEPGKYANIIDHGRTGRFELGGKMVGACHEPFLENYVLKLGDCEMVFYGHTHKPWIEERVGYRFVNPGTLGGVFERACFAVWDTAQDEPELRML